MLSRTWKWLGVGIPAAAVALASFVAVAAQDKPAEKKPEAKQDEGKQGKNIVETAAADAQFKTFTKLIKHAKLDETLKDEGPFTVFIPTDAAFDKLAKGTVDDWMKPENEAKLRNILNYHVLKGKHMAADVHKMKTAKMLNGKEVTISEKDGAWLINSAKLTKTDTAASNGVIHTIDTVLVPKEGRE